jgi:hypothetical protein
VSQVLQDVLFPALGYTSEFNIGLQFDQWVDQLLPMAGTPDVPDPLTQTAQCATYLNGLRDTLIASTGTRPLIRVADCNLDIMATLTGEMSGSAEDLMTHRENRNPLRQLVAGLDDQPDDAGRGFEPHHRPVSQQPELEDPVGREDHRNPHQAGRQGYPQHRAGGAAFP